MEANVDQLVGVSGTDATSTKRGYYYQDILTALAWTRLEDGEDLHVEVAEDYAIAGNQRAEIVQVKNTTASLTLTRAIPYIERVLQLSEENPGRELSFVYLTTSAIGEEQSPKCRPAGMPGILYWQVVQSGEDPRPLVEALKELAPPSSRLAKLLSSNSDDEIARLLINRVTWAVSAPESRSIKSELIERVARIAFEECGLDLVDGRKLWPRVLDEITQTSTYPDGSSRSLSYSALREFVREISSVTLTRKKYKTLITEAELAKNPPLVQIDNDIQRRLEFLQQTRVFSEATPVERALSLAEDVRDGGVCQLGNVILRAKALSWCARVILDERPQLAEELLDNADRIALCAEVALVRALIEAKRDHREALKKISGDTSKAAETIRYAIARGPHKEGGASWVERTKAEPVNFDAGGQFLALWDMLRAGRWSEAISWLERIDSTAFSEFPALLWAGGLALVAWAAADEVKGAALAGPPIVNEIPLRDDTRALAARRRAVALFKRFQPIADGWGLIETARLAEEYALWLMLEDKSSRPAAVAEILALWSKSEADSRWLPLALRGGLDVDLDLLAERIDKQALRYGSLNMDDARARLSIILASPAEKWVDNWRVIHDQIAPYFETGFLQSIYIQGLIHLGRLDEARAEIIAADGLPELQRTRLEIELGDADDRTLADYRAAVERDGSASSLHNLITALVKSGRSEDAISIAHSKYVQTGEHDDAEVYLRLLKRVGDWCGVLAFLDAHRFLLEQSTVLSTLYIDALVRFGRWEEAWAVAEETPDISDGGRIELRLHLAVCSGQWDGIPLLLENAQQRAGWDAEELIRFGKISTSLGNIPLAKKFAKRAVSEHEGPWSAWNSYMLAVQGNWEDDAIVREWLATGIASADSAGSPVKSKSVADLLELAPKWRERTDALEKSVSSASMFLALAAQQLNRPLSSLMVGTSFTNEGESDFRRISPIPAFSGGDSVADHGIPGGIVLDATAMLSLGRLGLLPKVLELFSTVYVPHSTGIWLFSELSRVRFHQPAQIADAKRILQAIARKEVRVLDAKFHYSSTLSSQVGSSLAQLVAACEHDRTVGRSSYVISSAPLQRVGSLVDEAADIGAAITVFRSTIEVVRSAHRYGAMPDEAFDEAVEYLSRVDKGWSGESQVEKGATLYLDDLTVTYLQHIGVLKWLSDAKFDLVVHSDLHSNAVALNELEGVNEAVADVLEGVRLFFLEGQAKGVVRILPLPNSKTEAGSPTVEDEPAELVEVTASVLLSQLFEHAPGAEAFIADDRAANRLQMFTYPNGERVPIRSTIDVIDWLRIAERIGDKDWLRFRTTLRRSGYLFMPISSNEILAALENSSVHDGELYESVAARAIRENHLLAQASGMLMLPDESAWLMNIGQQFSDAVSELWNAAELDASVAAKASWIVELSRLDGFADRMLGDLSETRWVDLDALTILRLVMNLKIEDSRRAAYNEWLDESFVVDMARGRPKVFAALCDVVRSRIIDLPAMLIDRNGPELVGADRKSAVALVSREFINNLPASIRDVMFEDDSLFEQLGLSRSSVLTVNIDGEPGFDTGLLYSAAARAHETHGDAIVHAEDGSEWVLRIGEAGVVVSSNGERKFAVAHSPVVSPIPLDRTTYARRFATEAGLAESEIEPWLARLLDGPLPATRIAEFERDIQCCPSWMAGRLERLLQDGRVTVSDLVPVSRKYYERLVAPSQRDSTIADYPASLANFDNGSASLTYRLIWSSHQTTSPVAQVRQLEAAELRSFVDGEIGRMDLWSLVGLIEGIAARPDAMTTIEDVTASVVRKFHQVISDEMRVELSARLVALTDSAVHTSGVLSDTPVFWRRLASISHASLIERAVLVSATDIKSFAEWASTSWSLFHAATLADLIQEPRWNAFMLNANQLKQEMIGRVLNAFEQRRGELTAASFGGLLYGEDNGSIEASRIVFFSILPGPLEGGFAIVPPLPEDLADLMDSVLEDEVQPLFRRVLAAAQLAVMGTLPEALQAKLARSVVALQKTDLVADAGDSITALLMRVSLAAAASRNWDLSNAVRQLVLGQPGVPMSIRAYAAISACGSESDIDRWREEVGHVLGRCAVTADHREDAEHVLFLLRTLSDVKPLLKPNVARTYARLLGVAKRLH